MLAKLIQQKDTLLLKTAFKFLCNELGITSEEQNLIEVKLVKRLAEGDGLCQGRYGTDNKLKDISINLKSYSSSFGLVHSLAHELVHARQHLRGEFSFAKEKHKFLFFTYYKTKHLFKGQCTEHLSYFEKPYEIEAFLLSDKLMMSFMKHIQLNSLFDHANTESLITDMIFKKNIGGLMSDTKQKQEQEYPRDFDIEFSDPHGDVDTKENNDVS